MCSIWDKSLIGECSNMRTVKDTNGNEYYVASVITSDDPNYAQIYPNHWQVNIGQSLYSDGKPIPESGITLPENIARRWLKNEIRLELGA